MIAVFWKDLRLILRDPWALGFALLVPVFVITVIAAEIDLAVGPVNLLEPDQVSGEVDG